MIEKSFIFHTVEMCSDSHGSDAIVPSLSFCDEASDNVQFDDDILSRRGHDDDIESIANDTFFFLLEFDQLYGII